MDQKYKKIIVAIDGSEIADKAFKKSLRIAKENQAQLFVTHVVDSRTVASAGLYDDKLSEIASKNAHEMLDEYMETAKSEGFENIEKRVEYGSPKVSIPKDVAKELDADLIVCGATGINAVERLLIGSVSENIARYATCDVLIIR